MKRKIVKKQIAFFLAAMMAVIPASSVQGAEFSSGGAEYDSGSSLPEMVFGSGEIGDYEIPGEVIQDSNTEKGISEEFEGSGIQIPDEDTLDENAENSTAEQEGDAADAEIFTQNQDGAAENAAGGDKTNGLIQEVEEASDTRITPEEKTDISTCKITVKASVTYTGTALTPEVTVNGEKGALAAERDYKLEYVNNTEIGLATVRITGTGAYEGTIEKNFKILPQAPKLKAASSAGYNSVKLTWQAVPGAESYIIYYKGNDIRSWRKLKTGVKNTSFVHTSSRSFPLVTGKTYTYTVKAVKGSFVSAYDKTGKTAKPVPAAPKLGKVQSTAYNKLKITWSKVTGASGYYVYRKSGNTWKRIGSTTGTSYVHTSSSTYPIKTGTTYSYTVKAYRKSGSTVVLGAGNSTGIKGKAVPNKAVLVSAESGTSMGKIVINWKKASGATHYLVYRKDASGKWQRIATVKGANTLSYTHTSSKKYPITTGKSYTYTVRSYNSNGKTYGSYDTKGKTIKGPSQADVLDAKLRKKAKSIVSQITTSGMSKSQKLYACWKYVTSGSNFGYWPKYPNLNKTGWQKECALDMLNSGRGNCYSFACAFAALASEVGYSPSVICGRVTGTRDGAADGYTRHCWVIIGGSYYDPEAQYAGWYKDVYGSSSYDIDHTVQKIVPFR